MKNHTFLLYKFIEMCQTMEGERTVNGLINIVTGKQNHQTWADVHYYHLQPFYRMVSKNEAEELLHQLLQHRLLNIKDNNHFTLTDLGQQFLNENFKEDGQPFRDGRIIPTMEIYWSFLHLLVQTLSNLMRKNHQFLPMVRDVFIQQRVKQWIASYGVNEGAKGLYEELNDLFLRLPEHISNLLVHRLSGYHRLALSLQQISKLQSISLFEAQWKWESALTYVYRTIRQRYYRYIPPVKEEWELVLSASCQQTRHLLNQDKDIEEISRIRGLKENTILDHIVEIALVDSLFDSHKYISYNDMEQVNRIYQENRTYRLKLYKDLLPHLSYFHIRLALAVLSRENVR